MSYTMEPSGGGRGAGTNYRVPAVQEGGPAPILHMFLPLSLKSFSVDCTNQTLRPNPSHSATGSQSFRFSVKIFSRSALAGGGAKTVVGGHATKPAAVSLFPNVLMQWFLIN